MKLNLNKVFKQMRGDSNTSSLLEEIESLKNSLLEKDNIIIYLKEELKDLEEYNNLLIRESKDFQNKIIEYEGYLEENDNYINHLNELIRQKDGDIFLKDAEILDLKNIIDDRSVYSSESS